MPPLRLPSAPAAKGFLVFSSDISCYHVAYIQEGISQYFRQGNRSISFFLLGITELEAMYDLRVHPVGAIGIFDCKESRAFFRERDIPFLHPAGEEEDPEIGFSINFNGEGIKAAKFLIEDLELVNLAYWGLSGVVSHERRLREFQEEAKTNGLTIQTLMQNRIPMQRFYEQQRRVKKQQMRKLADLIKSLRKPAGIFCANDQLALTAKVMAEKLDISVPGELNILGVGTLHQASGGWQESVSVVQLNHQKLGYESARLMDEYMSTGIPPESVCLSPENIIHRYTTLRRSLNDPLVQKAMEHIQDNLSISINQLAHSLQVSRRTLEMRFQAAGGLPVGKTIERERFNRAKYLLKNFRHSIESIASLSGYSDGRSMRRSFIRFLNITPMNYRRSIKTRK